jgi:hypothetical protein
MEKPIANHVVAMARPVNEKRRHSSISLESLTTEIMTHVEVLERSVGFPLELNPIVGRHEGVPSEVLNRCGDVKPWFLIAWNDDVSRTIGLAHKTHAVVLQRDQAIELAVNFMRPAKGSGFVDLNVGLQNQRGWLNLLQAPFFREEAVDWITAKKSQIESIFCVPITIFDRGSDY